jgi:Rieske Fe-S protein
MIFIKKYSFILILSVCILFFQCDKSNTQPKVDFTIATTDPQYADLLNIGGFDYVSQYGIIVAHRPNNTFTANSQYCTSDGCNLLYEGSLDYFQCPCDQSRFDYLGRVLSPPAQAPLYHFNLTQTGTILHIYSN